MHLLVNEWRLYLRQPLVWLSVAGMLAFSILIAQGLSTDDSALDKRLTLVNITMLMLTLPIVVAALTPTLLQRDDRHRMQELIHVTPVEPARRLAVRLTAFFGLIVVIVVASLLAQVSLFTSHDQFEFSILATALKNAFVLITPTVLLNAALGQFLAVTLRSATAVYALMMVVWGGYVTLASLNGSPVLAGSRIANEHMYQVMQWLDPMGFTALFVQYDTGVLHWQTDLLVGFNRIFWLLISGAIIYLTLRAQMNPVDYKKPQGRRWGRLSQWRIFSVKKAHYHNAQLTLILTACQTVIRNRITLLILLFYVMMVFSEVMSGLRYAEPLSQLEPNSLDALNRIVWDLMPLFGCTLMALWSWQLGWRNQRNLAADMIASTPVTNFQILIAQVTALLTGWFSIIAISALTTMLVQVATRSELDLLSYATTLLYTGLPILLFGLLCLAFHHLFHTALAGGISALILLILKFTPVGSLLFVDHPLFNIGSAPLLLGDALIGYEASRQAFWPFATCWIVVSMALLYVACCRTHRGTGLVMLRWRHLPATAYLALLCAIAAPVSLHMALQQEQPMRFGDARKQVRAEYEKQYGHWASVPQPVISHVDAKVDFSPQQGHATLAFNLALTNNTNQLIERVLIGHLPWFKPSRVELKDAKLITYDEQIEQHIFLLNQPLQPGQSIQLFTQQHIQQPRLQPSVGHQTILPSFAYVRGIPLLPTVGFAQHYTLRSSESRQKFGLAALNIPSPSQLTEHNTTRSAYPLMLNSIVSAPSDYSVLSQGQLVKQWQQDNREYRQYRTQVPIRAIPAWLATSLPSDSQWLGTPEHPVQLNVVGTDQLPPVHVQAVNDTLQWFGEHLTPYPYAQLSLITLPNSGPSGYALPQWILLRHRLAVRAFPATQAGFDQRYRRTVHEVAHQWFGHQIGYEVDADRAFLVESMAKYIELVVIEQHFGHDAMQALVDYERQRYIGYLRGKTDSPEALVDATSAPDMYSRATLVFAQLREEVGDERIIAALKPLFEPAQSQPVTSMTFVRNLLQQTEPHQHALIRSLLLGKYVNEYR